MIPRLTFLMLLIVGLALGPVRGVVACGSVADSGGCPGCCGSSDEGCCAIACETQPVTLPVQTAPATDAGKLLVAPVVVFLSPSPMPVVERPAVRKRLAARMPVAARLDLICVRLI